MRIPTALAAATVACAPLLSACPPATAPVRAGTEESASASTIAGVPPGIVDGATARKLVAAGVQVVDVRTPSEFEAGHVPGAKNVPVDEVGARATELGSPSTPVLLYCRSGHRAGIARETLQRLGYTAVYDMRTLGAWEQSAP